MASSAVMVDLDSGGTAMIDLQGGSLFSCARTEPRLLVWRQRAAPLDNCTDANEAAQPEIVSVDEDGRDARFFCWLAALAPEISQRYWKAVVETDAQVASEVISTSEGPVFALAETVTGGWPALWRAALEINSVASRYLRMPMGSATEEDVEAIRALMEDTGLML